jgi:hypothetical protein
LRPRKSQIKLLKSVPRRKKTVHALTDIWATLNLGQAIITGIGSLCALWATLDKIDIVKFQDVSLTSGADRMG